MIGVSAVFRLACLWNFSFFFVGPMYISIPRDVYEDDAHIYLQLYDSRERTNPILTLVNIVKLQIWDW